MSITPCFATEQVMVLGSLNWCLPFILSNCLKLLYIKEPLKIFVHLIIKDLTQVGQESNSQTWTLQIFHPLKRMLKFLPSGFYTRYNQGLSPLQWCKACSQNSITLIILFLLYLGYLSSTNNENYLLILYMYIVL